MKIVRTIKLKLEVKPEELLGTFSAYTKSFNLVAQTGWADNDFNSVSLHQKTYKEARKFLPSQLAISSRMKATEALLAVKSLQRKGKKVSCPQSTNCSIRLDARSFNIWTSKNECSILTVEGRKYYVYFMPEYFKQYLTWKRCSAELFIRKNKVFLNIVFSKDTEDVLLTDNVIGIDRGINSIAVTSNNKFYSGKKVKKVKRRYKNLRKRLQQKGTKSAKRHLRKISSKENRFMTDVNHCISKKLVHGAPVGTIFALENLKNIRDNSKIFRKEQCGVINSWSFYQLECFLKYKAEAHNCAIAYVDARYTSQKCSVCGTVDKSNRKTQAHFKCTKCGFEIHADLNAARNIRKNFIEAIRLSEGPQVNRPIVSDERQGLV